MNGTAINPVCKKCSLPFALRTGMYTMGNGDGPYHGECLPAPTNTATQGEGREAIIKRLVEQVFSTMNHDIDDDPREYFEKLLTKQFSEILAPSPSLERRVPEDVVEAKLPDARHLPFGVIDPDYARVYTLARIIAWQEGYALTLHGSFTRDLDLVAVPWTDRACEPEHLLRRVEEATKLKNNGQPATVRPHGRLTWTLLFPEFSDPRFVDFSVASLLRQPETRAVALPGLKSGHAIITPTCRANRTTTGAFLEAAERIQKLYDQYARDDANKSVNWHLVLVREEPVVAQQDSGKQQEKV